MSRFSRCLLAVLLAAPPQAIASLIVTPLYQILERSNEQSDPTPEFGPNLPLTLGAAVAICPPDRTPKATREPLAIEIAVALATVGLLVIPPFRRWALFFRLLD